MSALNILMKKMEKYAKRQHSQSTLVLDGIDDDDNIA
jgi:hypothetical protein